MKMRVILLFATLFSVALTLSAQGKGANEVIQALKKASSPELVKCLGEKVELVTPDGVVHVEREEARRELAAFFRRHRATGFKTIHQGKREESGFIIGTLTTTDGNYRVNCYFRKQQEEYVIHQIRIDKSNE